MGALDYRMSRYVVAVLVVCEKIHLSRSKCSCSYWY